ncbi:hypothetical protein BG55_17775 [Erwinia mallotivora]|uniref:Uncharacterized protein n=1 Tax=Erwinia mallotivora TaxID=69222 RepID=A0A014M8B4_9GAMM|nr:hypothetical protein BG55_17775 [Erwinia mallotivora]
MTIQRDGHNLLRISVIQFACASTTRTLTRAQPLTALTHGAYFMRKVKRPQVFACGQWHSEFGNLNRGDIIAS